MSASPGRNSNDAEKLYSDLSSLIGKKKQDLLRVTNAALVELFWEIGNTLNQIGTKKRQPSEFNSLDTLPVLLGLEKCAWFTSGELQFMMQFAAAFESRELVMSSAPFLTWYHFKVLAGSKNESWRIFCLLQAIQGNLDKNELEKEIIFPKKALPTMYRGLNSRKAVHIIQKNIGSISEKNIPTDIFFREPLLADFRYLLEYGCRPDKKIEKSRAKSGFSAADQLYLQLLNFSYRQTKWINCFINLALLELGLRLNLAFSAGANFGNYRRDYKAVANQLSAKAGVEITPALLQQSSAAAQKLDDPELAGQIAYLVSWEQIIALINAETNKARWFYARFAVKNKLSAVALRKVIAQNLFENSTGAGRENDVAGVGPLFRMQHAGIKSTRVPPEKKKAKDSGIFDYPLPRVLGSKVLQLFT